MLVPLPYSINLSFVLQPSRRKSTNRRSLFPVARPALIPVRTRSNRSAVLASAALHSDLPSTHFRLRLTTVRVLRSACAGEANNQQSATTSNHQQTTSKRTRPSLLLLPPSNASTDSLFSPHLDLPVGLPLSSDLNGGPDRTACGAGIQTTVHSRRWRRSRKSFKLPRSPILPRRGSGSSCEAEA